MADYQVTNYGLCGECRHHKYICDRDHSYAGFTTEEWICDNPKSVSYGKLMPYTGSCTCWEQREMTRADAIKALDNAWINGTSLLDANEAVKQLSDLPSADRPQGKWKAKSFHECFCHNCGFSFDVMKCEFLENMKFCPNCGVPKGADDE